MPSSNFSFEFSAPTIHRTTWRTFVRSGHQNGYRARCGTAGRPKFVVLRYLVRGAFVVDTDLMDLSGKRYYLDDMIDADMILRCGS
jgi:hypothetical protein